MQQPIENTPLPLFGQFLSFNINDPNSIRTLTGDKDAPQIENQEFNEHHIKAINHKQIPILKLGEIIHSQIIYVYNGSKDLANMSPADRIQSSINPYKEIIATMPLPFREVSPFNPSLEAVNEKERKHYFASLYFEIGKGNTLCFAKRNNNFVIADEIGVSNFRNNVEAELSKLEEFAKKIVGKQYTVDVCAAINELEPVYKEAFETGLKMPLQGQPGYQESYGKYGEVKKARNSELSTMPTAKTVSSSNLYSPIPKSTSKSDLLEAKKTSLRPSITPENNSQPSQVQKIPLEVKKIFTEADFSTETDETGNLIATKKIGDKNLKIFINPRLIQSQQEQNDLDVYKTMVKAALVLFQDELVLYHPKVEQLELMKKAFQEVIHEQKLDRSFKATSKREEFEAFHQNQDIKSSLSVLPSNTNLSQEGIEDKKSAMPPSLLIR